MISVLDNLVCRISDAGWKFIERGSRGFVQFSAVISQRSIRVVILSLAIAAMSAVDLYLTLVFVTQTGMNEMNPLARAIMEYQSPAILAAWKTATVVLSIGILMMIRKQRSAELGAWIGCLVMCWLMVHWTGFIDMSGQMDMELAQSDENPNWIMISEEAQGSQAVGSWIID